MSLRLVPLLAAGAALLATHQSLIWTNLAVIAVDILTLVVLARLMRAEGKRLVDLYRPFALKDIAWGLLCFVIVWVAWLPATFIGNLVAHHGAPPAPTSSMPEVPLWLGILALTVMPMTIAVAEEGLYRGYLQSRVAGRLSLVPSILLVSLVFGLQHIGFTVGDPHATLAKVITTFLAGLVFSGLMVWHRTTSPLVIAHWLFDLLGLGLPVFFLALS
ncbi:CPBP family intramembrane metalloprotease [Schaalia sp. 19OD2882]|uniref:CPBP family intramembrane glutamic endopeptidase n=1 Tax=Schaalia sp. 19OD2882 TaxID=2794089 RepID=UPI001C1F08E7|nr:CPBP family intramembrane glutamic endopeptidase [Schaalia sp. 19OD2882]QWW20332.1 CPBP family intramembrane metalloprotease [Schaalia sp. 19OD2882]